jgi:hypothetical protein
MTRDDEELLAGAVTFIRHQPMAFRDHILDFAQRLASDARFCNGYFVTHYDEKPDNLEIDAFYGRIQDTPAPRGDWKTGAFFRAVSSADGSGHTSAAEVIDAVVMECYYRHLIQRGERGSHTLRIPHLHVHKGRWQADS